MEKKIVVLVRQNGLGTVLPQDADFGHDMFDKFLHTLEVLRAKPQAICLYTEGVKLACQGSPVVPGLRLLGAMGVRILICTSCLEYYGLKEKVEVGEVCGMRDIVDLLVNSDKVITV